MNAPDVRTHDPPTTRLGRYELHFRLAAGGMATVYLARIAAQNAFEKWVAVKVIHPHMATDRGYVRMFLDEARLAARMDHPNLCHVFDFGDDHGAYYLAMEYLHGETLSAVLRHAIRERPLPIAFGVRIVADAARGLHAAHELRGADGAPAGVVHRDVSPQNIFVLYDGVAKVVDFGIARSDERTTEKTRTGVVKGKLAYMAPEQLVGAPLDRRVDVFALGIVLWECTLGRRLFQRPNDAETMFAVVRAEIPSPASIAPNYPPMLERIVMRALAADPTQRYQTAGELARDLERFVAHSGTHAGPEDLADFMGTLFAERKAGRERQLRGERRTGVITDFQVPSDASDGAPDDDLETHASQTVSAEVSTSARVSLPAPAVSPAREVTGVAAVLSAGQSTAVSTPISGSPRAISAAWLLVGMLAMLAIGAGITFWFTRTPRAPNTVTSATTSAPRTATAPSVTPLEPARAAAPAPAAPPTSSAPAPSAVASPSPVPTNAPMPPSPPPARATPAPARPASAQRPASAPRPSSAAPTPAHPAGTAPSHTGPRPATDFEVLQ